MGSHHQFQDIQGLASQQPASADMVLLGFGGVASLGGLRSLFYHVMARAGPRNVGTRAILGLFADGFAYFPKRRRRRERAAAGARVLYSPQTFASGAAAALGRGTARRRRPYAARSIAPRRRDSLATATAQLRPEIRASPP